MKTQVEKLFHFKSSTVVSGYDKQDYSIKEEIRHAATSFLHSAKTVCGSKRNVNFHRTLQGLKSDPSIKVCAFDKGNGIIIIDSENYFEKLDKIVCDESKFKEVKVRSNSPHPVISNENSLRNFLRANVKPFIPTKTYDSIYPSGSQPGKLYGLCKIHKKDFPFRPVVSMIGTAEYNLAKYLDSVIKPHIPSNYMLNSTNSFLERLKTFCFKPTDTLISFDVESLFTNVPLQETINMIADHVFLSENKPAYTKDTFIRLLQRATSGLFLYQNKLFKQVDGVTMGSPLGPTIANFCLANYENKLLSNTKTGTKPELYLRYVDDIFCIFRKDNSYEPFLQELNNLHKNLRFTFELGPDKLPFLDTLVSIPKVDDGHISTEVYRKPTFTGLILNASALCPYKWKIGLIQCFLHRAYSICSDWSLFDKEVSFLENLFSLNGYSTHLIQSCVNRFVSRKVQVQPNLPPKADSVECIFCIPYIGQPSIIYARKIKQIFKRYYSIDVRTVFTTFKVKNYFSLKCCTPFALKAKVIYKFTCLCDAGISYIGKTKRHLAVRAKEHSTTSSSAIKQHLDSCMACGQSQSNYGCFSIIDSGKSDFECTIKEALHIKIAQPYLNRQLFASGSLFTLQVF